MLDIDYLGELNNPDGLPGRYDQRTAIYCYIFAVHDAVVSEPFVTFRMPCVFETPRYPGMAPPTERALSQRP
eukprot:6207981-Pleurochrysis_carterae.AAC.1